MMTGHKSIVHTYVTVVLVIISGSLASVILLTPPTESRADGVLFVRLPKPARDTLDICARLQFYKRETDDIDAMVRNYQNQDLLHHGCDEQWSWNKRDKSHEVKLFGNKYQTAHFHPNWSNGTAGVRGSQPLNYGRHYWEIKVSQRIFGTSMMFGIGTKKARLHVDAFVNMLGEDGQSWGLSHKGFLWHNGHWKHYTSPFKENEATLIGVLFDWYEGTLSFFKDGTYLGVAFSGLNEIEEDLYPIVCSTAAKTEMTLGIRKRGYISLQDRCRATILSKVKQDNDIDNLPLPNRIKTFLKDLSRPLSA